MLPGRSEVRRDVRYPIEQLGALLEWDAEKGPPVEHGVGVDEGEKLVAWISRDRFFVGRKASGITGG